MMVRIPGEIMKKKGEGSLRSVRGNKGKSHPFEQGWREVSHYLRDGGKVRSPLRHGGDPTGRGRAMLELRPLKRREAEARSCCHCPSTGRVKLQVLVFPFIPFS